MIAAKEEAAAAIPKMTFIDNWLDESSWSSWCPADNESRRLETPFKLPPNLWSPYHSFQTPKSMLRRVRNSDLHVTDTDYRHSLRCRDIHVNHQDPPPDLVPRAQDLLSRTRSSPELDDEVVQHLIRASRRVEEEEEAATVPHLAPHITPAVEMLPDKRLASNAGQLWCNSVPIPVMPSARKHKLPPLPKPQPGLIFGYSDTAFTENQSEAIDLLVDRQSGRSYAVPDLKVRFPFLQVEFKSQGEDRTHRIATNQAAGAGAIALNGNLELIRRGFGLDDFDYAEPRYFSISMNHEQARINVHWLAARARVDGQPYGFHVQPLSKYRLDHENGLRTLSRAIKNILDHGVQVRLGTLCDALDAYRERVINNEDGAADELTQQPQEDEPEAQAGQVISAHRAAAPALNDNNVSSRSERSQGSRSVARTCVAQTRLKEFSGPLTGFVSSVG